MKLAIEPFLFDNALMNGCVFALTAAWLGVRIRLLPTLLLSLLGAVYALLSLFVQPVLREWYLKVPCFLLLSLPLFRSAGSPLRVLPFLLLSAATVGGAALLLTLLFGGSITYDGTLIGTVTVRAALVSAALAGMLPRILRAMLRVRRKKDLYTTVIVRLKHHTYQMKALIDSGNLLKEPLSGLPVMLIDFEPDHPTRPVPFQTSQRSGVLLAERAQSLFLPDYGGAAADCFCAESPLPIPDAQAILPESVLPQKWRTEYDRMASPYLAAPAFAARRWQTRYLLVHSHKRRLAGAARSGRGSALHFGGADRPGGKG